MFSLRRILPKINFDEPIPSESIQELKITNDDFEKASTLVEPSAMREVMVEVPDTAWDDIGGLEETKEELREAVEWPLKYPKLFEKAGIRPLNGILLFGPPGCGKTLLAKAIASESQSNFIAIKGPEIYSKWVGESERAVREIFRKARQAAPSIIYFDEIDAITSGRGMSESTHTFASIVNQILVEMDGIENRKGIVIIASTNRPDIVDPAFLRPGRFDRLLFVEAPDHEGRLKILKVHTKGMPLAENISLKKFAQMTEGYSGADLENVCREAGMQAIREEMENIKNIENKHFEFALSKIKSTLPKSVIQKYENMAKQITESRNIKESKADLYR
jgi:transitional endoplasmic reticulum ATPase